MADLRFDTEVMRNTAKSFMESADNMIELRDSVEKSIEDLKDYYLQSSAGDAIAELFDDTWSEDVERNKKILYKLAEMLEYVAGVYEDIYNSINISTQVTTYTSGSHRF